MIRGAQGVVSSLCSALVLMSTSQKEWRSEIASSLAGVIVVPDNVTREDWDNPQNRQLPFLLFGRTHLSGSCIILAEESDYLQESAISFESTYHSKMNFFNFGRLAAESLNHAFLTG